MTDANKTKINSNRILHEIFWEILHNFLLDFSQFFVNLCNNSIYVKISPRLFFLLLKFPEDLKQDKYQYWFKTIKNINSNISGN